MERGAARSRGWVVILLGMLTLVFFLPRVWVPVALAGEEASGEPGSGGALGGGTRETRAKQLVEEISRYLDGWRVGESEKLVARLMELDPDSTLTGGMIRYFQARIAYYGGDYGEAARLVEDSGGMLPGGARGSEELARLIAAASAQVEGYDGFETPGGRFRVLVQPGPDLVMIPILLAHLPIMEEKVGQILGAPGGDQVIIHIYPEPASLTRVTSLSPEEIENSGIVAVCGDNRLMVLSPRLMVGGYPWIDTVTHEYVHLQVTRMSKGLAPVWIHEGIARWVEGAVVQGIPPKLDRGSARLLVTAAQENRLIKFSEMDPSIAALPTREAVALAFAQVFSLMDYLVETSGVQGMGKVLGLLAEGVEAPHAVARVMGSSWGDVERGWRKHIKVRGESVITGAGGPSSFSLPAIKFRKAGVPVQEQELDWVAEHIRDQVRVGMQLEGMGRYGAAGVMYGRVMGDGEAADPHVAARLAFSLVQTGEGGSAEQVLLTALKGHPRYGLLYKNMALVYGGRGDWQQVRKWSELALELDPFDPSVYQLLGEAYGNLGLKELGEQAGRALELLDTSADRGGAQGPNPTNKPGEDVKNDRKQ